MWTEGKIKFMAIAAPTHILAIGKGRYARTIALRAHMYNYYYYNVLALALACMHTYIAHA